MNKQIGISLGWNCYPSTKSVEMELRSRKSEGYHTCPFDLCVTNLKGIILCLQEDFKYFTDPNYLRLIKLDSGSVTLKNQTILVNIRYNFIFNHESPGHANLYITEKWEKGINHFVDNNFEEFIKRYNNRINNFRNYLNNNNILFVMSSNNINSIKLKDILKKIYPTLNFDVLLLIPKELDNFIYRHHHLMGYTNETYLEERILNS